MRYFPHLTTERVMRFFNGCNCMSAILWETGRAAAEADGTDSAFLTDHKIAYSIIALFYSITNQV